MCGIGYGALRRTAFALTVIAAVSVTLLQPDAAYAEIRYADNLNPKDVSDFQEILGLCLRQSTKFREWWTAGDNKSPFNSPDAHIIINLVHGESYIDAWQGNDGKTRTTTINVNIDNIKLLPQLTQDPKTGHWIMPPGSTTWALTQIDDVAHFMSEAWMTTLGGTANTLSTTTHVNAIRGLQTAVRNELGLPEITQMKHFHENYTYFDAKGKTYKSPGRLYLEIETTKGREWITYGADGAINVKFVTGARYEINDPKGGEVGMAPIERNGQYYVSRPQAPSSAQNISTISNWDGFSVSGLGGVAFGGGQWRTRDVVSLGAGDPLVDSLKDLADTNIALALQLGYAQQFAAQWLYGIAIELDYNYIVMDPGIPGTGAIGTAAVRANDSVAVKLKGGFALLGRLGYLVDPTTLIYITGGPAWQRASANLNCTVTGVCGSNGIPAFSQTNSDTLTGWTAGVGVEKQLAGAWRGRVEYRYSDYGMWNTSFGQPNNLLVAAGIDVHKSALLFGLTYAFGGP